MSHIVIRYWAGARAAAGTDSESLPVEGAIALDEVVRRVAAAHSDDAMTRMLQVCSTLVGDQPVRKDDAGSVLVQPGQTVEFLPPFAGG